MISLKRNVCKYSTELENSPVSPLMPNYRYPGDIANIHGTPRTSQAFKYLKHSLMEERCKVHKLKQQIEYRNKKMTSMNALLKDLKDKALISENAQDLYNVS